MKPSPMVVCASKAGTRGAHKVINYEKCFISDHAMVAWERE